MNICFPIMTFNLYRGGIESYTAFMAKSLASQGHRVHIVTRNHKAHGLNQDLGPNVYVHTVDFNDEPFKGYWRLDHFLPLKEWRYSKAVAKKVQEIHRQFKLDAIEVPTVADGFSLMAQNEIPVSLRMHSYSGLTDQYFQGTLKSSLRKFLMWHMKRTMIKKAKKVSAVSEDFAQLAKKIWNLPHKEIAVVHNTIDQNVFKPGGLENRQAHVLFVGRLEKNKGIDTLVKAAQIVIKDHPQVKFLFAGRGSDEWRKFIHKNLPQENYLLLGQISESELIDLYKNNMVAVFPSRYESGGIVAQEAMASGCVVIASNVGGFKEIITNGVDGILVEAEDATTFAQSIINVITDLNLRLKLAENGIKKINTQFSSEKISRQMMDLYVAVSG